MQRALFYTKHTDTFTSPQENLLVFQVKTNIAQDHGLLEIGTTTLDTCKAPAAVVQQRC